MNLNINQTIHIDIGEQNLRLDLSHEGEDEQTVKLEAWDKAVEMNRDEFEAIIEAVSCFDRKVQACKEAV